MNITNKSAFQIGIGTLIGIATMYAILSNRLGSTRSHQTSAASAQIASGQGVLYILQDGKISVYVLDGVLGMHLSDRDIKDVKLRLVATQRVPTGQ